MIHWFWQETQKRLVLHSHWGRERISVCVCKELRVLLFHSTSRSETLQCVNKSSRCPSWPLMTSSFLSPGPGCCPLCCFIWFDLSDTELHWLDCQGSVDHPRVPLTVPQGFTILYFLFIYFEFLFLWRIRGGGSRQILSRRSWIVCRTLDQIWTYFWLLSRTFSCFQWRRLKHYSWLIFVVG